MVVWLVGLLTPVLLGRIVRGGFTKWDQHFKEMAEAPAPVLNGSYKRASEAASRQYDWPQRWPWPAAGGRTRHCYSCMSPGYKARWGEHMMLHFYPPKSFSHECAQPLAATNVTVVQCRAQCITVAENAPNAVGGQEFMRACVDRLLLFPLTARLRRELAAVGLAELCRVTHRSTIMGRVDTELQRTEHHEQMNELLAPGFSKRKRRRRRDVDMLSASAGGGHSNSVVRPTSSSRLPPIDPVRDLLIVCTCLGDRCNHGTGALHADALQHAHASMMLDTAALVPCTPLTTAIALAVALGAHAALPL